MVSHCYKNYQYNERGKVIGSFDFDYRESFIDFFTGVSYHIQEFNKNTAFYLFFTIKSIKTLDFF